MPGLTALQKRNIRAVKSRISPDAIEAYQTSRKDLSSFSQKIEEKYGLSAWGQGKGDPKDVTEEKKLAAAASLARRKLTGGIADAAREAGLDPEALKKKDGKGVTLENYIREAAGVPMEDPTYDRKTARSVLRWARLLPPEGKGAPGTDIPTGSVSPPDSSAPRGAVRRQKPAQTGPIQRPGPVLRPRY